MNSVDFVLLVCTLVAVNMIFIATTLFKIRKMAIILFRTNDYCGKFNSDATFLSFVFVVAMYANINFLNSSVLFNFPIFFIILTSVEVILLLVLFIFERAIKKTTL